MKFIEQLCPPALLYLLFIVVQLGFDLVDMRLWTALSKVVWGGATVYVLNMLCNVELGIVSWFIVAMPFIITALATSIAIGVSLDDHVSAMVFGEKKTA